METSAGGLDAAVRLFLTKNKLEAFSERLEAYGVLSLKDLLDPNVLNDDDLRTEVSKHPLSSCTEDDENIARCHRRRHSSGAKIPTAAHLNAGTPLLRPCASPTHPPPRSGGRGRNAAFGPVGGSLVAAGAVSRWV